MVRSVDALSWPTFVGEIANAEYDAAEES
jgi:hypothetical protein